VLSVDRAELLHDRSFAQQSTNDVQLQLIHYLRSRQSCTNQSGYCLSTAHVLSVVSANPFVDRSRSGDRSIAQIRRSRIRVHRIVFVIFPPTVRCWHNLYCIRITLV